MSEVVIVGGLLRIEGQIICRVFERDGKVVLQFKDKLRPRAVCRGTEFMEIFLDDFSSQIQSQLVIPIAEVPNEIVDESSV